MSKMKKLIEKTTRYVVDLVAGNGLMQEENTVTGERLITPGMPRRMISGGIGVSSSQSFWPRCSLMDCAPYLT